MSPVPKKADKLDLSPGGAVSELVDSLCARGMGFILWEKLVTQICSESSRMNIFEISVHRCGQIFTIKL